MTKKIIFSGGGTGGHILPAINLMKHFFEKKYKVILVTDKKGNNFINNSNEFKTYILKTSTPTDKSLIKKLFSIFFIFTSIIRSIIILKKEKPDLVFGLGGYVSFPISFASRFFNLPLFIYENNMVVGRANKYLLSSAKKIFLSKNKIKNISEKYENKKHVVGSILDKNIINCKSFKKNDDNNLSILVLGGRQGAKVFGEIIPNVIKKINDEGIKVEINQQCIKGQKNTIVDFYKENKIKNYVFEFDKNILKLILSSDLAITRCGSSTIDELAHTITPFIAIPLPNSIDNHQYLNARFYQEKDCCLLLEQANFNTNSLFNLIIENKNKLESIRQNLKKIHNNSVYSNIESKIKEFI